MRPSLGVDVVNRVEQEQVGHVGVSLNNGHLEGRTTASAVALQRWCGELLLVSSHQQLFLQQVCKQRLEVWGMPQMRAQSPTRSGASPARQS